MVFQVALVLYSCWLFLRLLRDPVSAFPWILPLVVVTRTLDLPVIGERLVIFDLFLVLWFVLFFLNSLARRNSFSLPREALLVLLLYGLFLGVNALSLLDARDLVGGGIALVVYGFGGLICLATLIAVQELGSIKPFVIALCVVFVVVIFFAMAEVAGLSWLIEKSHPARITSTFRNPNQLGFFLTIVIPPGFGIPCFKISRSQVSEKAGSCCDIGLGTGDHVHRLKTHASDRDHGDWASPLLGFIMEGGKNLAKISAHHRRFLSGDSLPSVPGHRPGSFWEIPKPRLGVVREPGNISERSRPRPGFDGTKRWPVSHL